jgi:hypothetical protein
MHQRRLIASNPSGKDPSLNHFPRVPQFLYSSSQLTNVENLLFRNEAVNTTLLVFTVCFPDFYGFFNEIPLLPHLFVALTMFVIWKYYKNCTPGVTVLPVRLKIEKYIFMGLIACVYFYNQVFHRIYSF